MVYVVLFSYIMYAVDNMLYYVIGCTPRDEMKDIYPPFGCFALVKVCAGLCGNGYSSTYYTTNPSTGQYIPNVQCSCCRETSMAERTIACNGE